jgi:hypothetical protein
MAQTFNNGEQLGSIRTILNDNADEINTLQATKASADNPAFTGNVTVTTNSANPAVTITQTGSGNAFVVEDSTSPDSTPFVIAADGSVGIGTTSPSQKLSVIGYSDLDGLRIGGADTSNTIYQATGTLSLSTGGGGILFKTNLTDRMAIDSSGNVGIGTTTPAEKLDVIGQIQARPIVNGTGLNDWFSIGSVQEASNFGVALGLFVEDQGTNKYAMTFGTKSGGGNPITERMRIDATGNVGIGVTPSAWSSVFKTVELGTSPNTTGAIGATSGGSYLSFNTYYSSGAQWLYKTTQSAAYYTIESNAHKWYNAPSGTADTAITFTQAMTLDANGSLLVGGTSLVVPTTTKAQITSANIGVDTGGGGQAIVAITSDAYAADKGASLGLGGKAAAGGTVVFGTISGRSEGAGNAGYLQFATLNVGGTMLERMRIDSAGSVLIGGSVGIGTSLPATILDVYYAGGQARFGGVGGNNTLQVYSSGGTMGLWAGGTSYMYSNGAIQFKVNATTSTSFPTGGSDVMIMTASGDVGIGTSFPASKLHVEGGSVTCNVIASSGNGTFRLANSATAGDRKEFFIVLDTTNNRVDMQAIQQGVAYNSITLNAGGGNVGIGTSSPSASSVLDAQSTTQGVRFPNMTTTQKNAISNVAGNVVFDTTLGKLCVNSGSGWQTITSV